MASTQARQTARARARAAHQKVVADRKARDDANIASMTEYFAAAEQIEAAQVVMANAVEAIRGREGTLAKAAEILGLGIGQARKLVALLGDSTSASNARDDSGAVGDADSSGDTVLGADAEQIGASPTGTTGVESDTESGSSVDSDAATT